MKRNDLSWDVMCLPHVISDSPTMTAINSFPRQIALSEIAGRSDYLPCSPYEITSKTFSKNFRGNLRKARNKLQAMEDVRFVTAQKGDNLIKSFEDFLNVESSGWKGKKGSGTGIKLNPEAESFYRNLACSFSEFGRCEINLLKVNNQCVAGQFCLIVGETFYILKIGYDEYFSHLAPGNMLLENLLQRKANVDHLKYISLVTGSSWHVDWKPLSKKVMRVFLFNNKTLRGLLVKSILNAKDALRPLLSI